MNLTWNEITTYYRKKPARFKAFQYNKDTGLLPPGISRSEDGSVFLESKINIVEDTDWLILDLFTGKIHLLKDDVFNLVFEES